nr:aminotransferase class V-fold PLP-dependent enzyme [Microvirga arsenatis]
MKNEIYVDNASVSPLPRRVQAASEHCNTIISEQLRDAKEIAKPYFDRGRTLAAKLVGSSPQNVAYFQNTSHGLPLVALGVDWRPGDNLIVCAQEFPANYLCWIQLAAMGVEVRQVTSPGGRLEPDLIREAMDDRTRVVAVSHVQFYSGFRVDVSALGDLCSECGALLVVDGTQSVGALQPRCRSRGNRRPGGECP